MDKIHRTSLQAITCACLLVISAGPSFGQRRPDSERRSASASGFARAKTVFQTNTAYDPRIALAVDGVIVHRHGEKLEPLRQSIGSWKSQGFAVGRMFFADSDAANEYWTGKWDGRPHEDEVERDEKGEIVKCSDIRPYMLPTDGWIRYLEEMTITSLQAGADAILPEEPLAHVHTGYEDAFKRLWRERYGQEWQPESASLEARFLTAQLKNELYVKLEQRLAEVTADWSRRHGRDVPFILPIHSMYSNVASRLVAPLGTSLDVRNVDGYIGQIWTGPVRWAMHHYGSEDKSFFASAYALYDYFVQLVAGSGRKLWLLSDPVEDDPNHKWSEFQEWYEHCVAAKLLFDEVDTYEVMPWPDRIFLPGHTTGGSTPAPEDYRISLLSTVQVLQEVPAEGSWLEPTTEGIGIAVSDTIMWEKEDWPPLDGLYGLFLPLVNEGVPAKACVIERAGDSKYLDQFNVIVLSYVAFKPLDDRFHKPLVHWVKKGGVLVLLGEADELSGAKLWWAKAGYPSPLHHLAKELNVAIESDKDYTIEKGTVLRRTISPRAFADPARAKELYLPLISEAVTTALLHRTVPPGAEAKDGAPGLKTPGAFCMQRGPFVIGHALSKPIALQGRFINVFDAKLPVEENPTIQPGQSRLYRDVTDQASGRKASILHTTHRLMDEKTMRDGIRAVVRGPAETPAVLRIHCGSRKLKDVSARDTQGNAIPVQVREDGQTLLLQFPNVPAGVSVLIRWER